MSYDDKCPQGLTVVSLPGLENQESSLVAMERDDSISRVGTYDYRMRWPFSRGVLDKVVSFPASSRQKVKDRRQWDCCSLLQ